MEKHHRLVGILYIVYGCIHVMGILTAILIIHDFSFWTNLPDFIPTLITSILAVSGVVSILGIVGGIGILNNHSWAGTLLLVLGFIYLLNIPLGTMLGVYTIWVFLLQEKDPKPANRL